MFLTQEFKTYEGARKRADFENAHCDKRWHYMPVRFVVGDNEPDKAKYEDTARVLGHYIWRLYKQPR
jgi:hypothetical protein